MDEKVATDEARPTVHDVTKKFSVFEDGAYALQVQEELNAEHYGGNISRRRTVRSDLQVAKTKAEEEALEAFREEHEIAERNRKIEEDDKEAAKRILAEEAERARLEEERDQKLSQSKKKSPSRIRVSDARMPPAGQEIAKQLQLKEKEEFMRKKKEKEEQLLQKSEELARSISREEEEKAKRRQVAESEDALAALRLTAQESGGLSGGVGEVNGGPDLADDELIARELQAHEKDKYLLHKKKKEERRRLKEQERLALRLQQEEKERMKMEALKSGEPPSPERDGMRENGEGHVQRVETDEVYARHIHRAEVQRAMDPEEERLRRERQDAEIAKKMQHAEVIKAKERQRRRAEREAGRTEERGHRHESDRGHRHESDRGHRHDPARSPRQDPERGGERQREPGSGRREGPDRAHPHHETPQVARNPMVDSYPRASSAPREPPPSQIQPVQGQRRSSAKEPGKEGKSRGGLFSKSKKK